MSKGKLAFTLPWRENALFKEKNVFVSHMSKGKLALSFAMTRKRTFRRKEHY